MFHTIHLPAGLLLFWYLAIFIGTEILSYFHLLTRVNILIWDAFTAIIFLILFGNRIKDALKNVSFNYLSVIITLILLLTFVQGIFSAPNTTDAMTYHITRILYWLQDGTVAQTYLRGSHDFMPPFAEYILLHLYSITGTDRLLFLSQWIAYIVCIILAPVIFQQLEGKKEYKHFSTLSVTFLPMAVMQSTSTQVDLITAVLTMISLHIVLLLIQTKQNIIQLFIVLGIVVGLGLQVKMPFLFFALVPLGLLSIHILQNRFLQIPYGLLSMGIALVIQARYYLQNKLLFGNILGQRLAGSGNTYVNERFDIAAITSNTIRNIFTNIPIPIFGSNVQHALEKFHTFIGLSINDPATTYFYHTFHILPVIFPQEDIVSNPIHMMLVLISGVLVWFINPNNFSQANILKILYSLLLLSFIIFSAVLKWEPYHPRLELPFFMIGSILAVIVLSHYKYGIVVLKGGLIISGTIALCLVLFNINRPYVSYKYIYPLAKRFITPYNQLPEAFYERPRFYQYFNSRHYLFEPYNQVLDVIKKNNYNEPISFHLMDEYEYPARMLKQQKHITNSIARPWVLKKGTLIISSSAERFKKKGFTTTCFKTKVDYGYICLSK